MVESQCEVCGKYKECKVYNYQGKIRLALNKYIRPGAISVCKKCRKKINAK